MISYIYVGIQLSYTHVSFAIVCIVLVLRELYVAQRKAVRASSLWFLERRRMNTETTILVKTWDSSSSYPIQSKDIRISFGSLEIART